MPWKVERRKNKFVVVRENGKVVAEHDSKAKAMRQVRALYASEYWVRKARARMFASRSEAGRYAAEQRWKNLPMSQDEMDALYNTLSLESGEILNRLSKSEDGRLVVSAIFNYVSNGHKAMNKHLRNPDDRSSYAHPEVYDKNAQITERLVQSFDKLAVELPKTITVYRGIQRNPLNDAVVRPRVGDEFTDLGFSSCSTNRDIAESFADPSGVSNSHMMMRIVIPKGTKVVIPPSGYPDTEKEVLVRNGSRFRVTGVKEIEDPDEGFYTFLEVELVS
jgi:hypothetical protein